MASSSFNAELNFAGIQIDDIFSSNGIIQTLRKYDKFLEVYVNNPANRDYPLPLHFHLSMQGIIMDGLSWPYSDVGYGAEVRAETQRRLKAVYVDPILEAAKMTARAPIININHTPDSLPLQAIPGRL